MALKLEATPLKFIIHNSDPPMTLIVAPAQNANTPYSIITLTYELPKPILKTMDHKT